MILIAAAILGDAVNYSVGRYFASRGLAGEKIPFIKKKHIDRTHERYEKYAAKTIVLARFVPIMRTFAPFVAGRGEHVYRTFAIYNVIGASPGSPSAWVRLRRQHPLRAEKLRVLVPGIIGVSVPPIVIDMDDDRRTAPAASGPTTDTSRGPRCCRAVFHRRRRQRSFAGFSICPAACGGRTLGGSAIAVRG